MESKSANCPGSVENDAFESPTHEGLPKAVLNRLRDPRMRFRTMSSLASLLERALRIGSAGEHRMPLLPPRTLSRRQQTQLRVLGALATLLVRRDEVAATAGSLEQVFVTYNLAPPKLDGPKAFRESTNDLIHVYTPRPDGLTSDAVMAYLVSARAGQTFVDHANVIMQFTNQFYNLDTSPHTPGLMRTFAAYVVGSSAPKMFDRLNHPKYSLPYFDAIVQLPTRDVKWVIAASPPNRADISFIKILHGMHGVRFLQWVQQSITQPPTDPHWARVIAELPPCGAGDPDAFKLLFPNLWGLTAQSEAFYTRNTYREFHQLLCLSIIGYRTSLSTLVGLSDPTQEDLLSAIDVVCDYLMILRPIAISAAISDHLSAVADARRARVARGSLDVVEELLEVEESEERLEHIAEEGPEVESCEDLVDMDVIHVSGWGYPPHITPHVQWLRLQAVYLTAVSDIMDLSRLGPHIPGSIKLVIHTTPPADDFMAPLMPVIESVVNHHELALRLKGPDGERLKDMDMIKTALEDLREYTGPSLGRSLDLMCQGSGFRGQVHCEMALAALMFDPTPNAFSICDKRAIGVSRRCCPACSAVLRALSFDRPINVSGHHMAVVPCALPDNLPPSDVEFLLKRFGRELSYSLRELCILSQRCRGSPYAQSMDLRARIRCLTRGKRHVAVS